MTNINAPQKIEIGTLLKKHHQELDHRYHLSFDQNKAITDLIKCRTSESGGHLRQCTHCGHREQAYNSCRNRHCPKCQFTKQIQWVDKLKSRLPDVRYYHLVFTIPQALHSVFYINQSVCYDLLLKQACRALKQVVNSRYKPAMDIGGISLLHTWGQALTYHPHVHMLVPAGGISEDRMEWIHTNRKFFVPGKALSRVFRGLLCRSIEKNTLNDRIFLPEGTAWKDIRNKLYRKEWNVNIKPAISGPNHVLEYLGRYTHRVAIANERITHADKDTVSFRIKDYRCEAMIKTISLPVVEFLRRFLQHVLPGGFYKIRYFGYLTQKNIGELGQQVLALLEQTPFIPAYEGLSGVEIYHAITGNEIRLCPVCHTGRLVPAHMALAPS